MESSMKEQEEVLILAIESSCDETAAAVVKNGRTVLSNIINSQIDIHTLYGGVVPEIASRKHIEKINIVIEQKKWLNTLNLTGMFNRLFYCVCIAFSKTSTAVCCMASVLNV